MSLYIKRDNTKLVEWHVGEVMPRLEGRVITFSADGDELLWLIDAIRSSIERGQS